MSDNFIMFYNFIRRRWINSFLTFDKFSIFDNLFFLTSSLKKHTFYNLLINNILYLCVT